jgi:N-acyl-D-amino-acid deacylase
MAYRTARDYVNGLASLLVALLAASSTAAQSPELGAAPTALPTTGERSEQFAEVDSWLQTFLTENQVPGGSLAIAVDGQLKLVRGYGYADRETQQPVQPDALFRIASVSKPITAVAVLQLVDRGKLRLDDKIIDVLQLRQQSSRSADDYDPWWNEITVAHLLTHSGGWDRDRSGDPMFLNKHISQWLAASMPVSHAHVIEYQFLRRLDFVPGERYAYSNFGYCLLGRAVERVGGLPYEKYVQQHIFAPRGITSARIGESLASERAEGEVKYYTVDQYRAEAVVGSELGAEVPGQYGGWDHRLLDAHGGWIMSSGDLVKFGLGLDIANNPTANQAPANNTVAVENRLLRPTSTASLFTAHLPLQNSAAAAMPGYGYGWVVTQLDDSPLVFHNGALPCTGALLARLGDRIWFAVLLNQGRSRDGRWLAAGLERELGRRIGQAVPSNRSCP